MTLSRPIPFPTAHPRVTTPFYPLPGERLQALEGWAMISRSLAYVYRPSTLAGLHDVLALARRSGRSIIARGAGYSYGDVALNAENLVVDLTRMNRILAWDPATGLVTVEPGVTIKDLWRYIVEDGWWIPVVPGATRPTIAGCLATNVHGKNNWRAGALGEHVRAFDLLLPSGETLTCTPEQNPDLFEAAIGGCGLLGFFTSITLQMKRTPCGVLHVTEIAVPSLDEMFAQTERVTDMPTTDYMVGWIDGYQRGGILGRGLIQWASEVTDAPTLETLRSSNQEVSDYMLGVLARSRLWMLAKPGANGLGAWSANLARYSMGAALNGRSFRQPHGRFHFFHDYSPNTRMAFRPGGFIQYQVFAPTSTAPALFADLLTRSDKAGFVPPLITFKRHRTDRVGLLRYNLDGYSLSLDYQVTPRNSVVLHRFVATLTPLVLGAGGTFYFAKDAVITRGEATAMLSPAAVQRFLALKDRYDPQHVLQSDLYHRVFAP